MPHIVVEYTPNLGELPFDAMLASVTQSLSESPEVQEESDLKARVLCTEAFRVGLVDSQRGFIHVTVRLLSGRSPQAKRDISQRTAQAMLKHMPPMPEGLTAHLSVEIVDMDRDSYSKFKLS